VKLSIEREGPQTLFEPGELTEYGRSPVSRHPSRASRNYQAARRTRTNRDFLFDMGSSPRVHIYRDLRTLRNASRKLARNNDYMIQFLRMNRVNVVGPASDQLPDAPTGMRLQARAKTPRGKPDDKLNKAVQEAWSTFSYPENASGNGRLSLLDILLKAQTSLARDGENLARLVPADNPFGIAVKPLDVSWLDETYNERRPNGNRVIMSVEIDKNDRPVQYWLTPPADDYSVGITPNIRQRTPVPAEEIIHTFLPFDQNCGDDTSTRGVPWAHAAMVKLWHMGAYDESAIIAARIGASKMGFFSKKKQDDFGLSDDTSSLFLPKTSEAEDERPRGPKFPDGVEPGQFDVIDDYEFQGFDPKYPSDLYGPFNSAMLHGVACSLGPAYFSLASDLKEINFSSARIGLQGERDWWRGLQFFLILHYLRRIYLAWLKSCMVNDVIPLSPSDLVRLSLPRFVPRGWAYMQPVDDVTAIEKGIAIGINTRTDELAEQGQEFSEVIETLGNENDLADAKGVDISPARPGAIAAPAAEANGKTGEEGKG
jgi:lambda family phage portal protein